MVTAVWGVKGGAGVTTVAVALSMLAAAQGDRGVLLVDLVGDVPAVLPTDARCEPGIAEWMRWHRGPGQPWCLWSGRTVGVGERLALAPRGCGCLDGGAAAVRLWHELTHDPREVIVDCGQLGVGDLSERVTTAGHMIARRAHRSILVTRACGLALRRLRTTPVPITGVIVVRERDREVTRSEIEEAADAPVLAELPYDPAVARAVDSGALTTDDIPMSLAGALDAASGATRSYSVACQDTA